MTDEQWSGVVKGYELMSKDLRLVYDKLRQTQFMIFSTWMMMGMLVAWIIKRT